MPALRGRAAELHRKLRVVHVTTPLPPDADSDVQEVPVSHKRKAPNIPTPGIKIVENLSKPPEQSRFSLPRHYLRTPSSAAGILNQNDHYDLLLEDMEWLKEYTSTRLPEGDVSLTENIMEDLIDLFEKSAGRLTRQFDCKWYFPLESAKQTAAEAFEYEGQYVEDIYYYWLEKRNALGKALMRKFQEQPAHDDPSPYVAFRPRERERRQTRYVKKNDIVAYKKLDFLRQKDLGEVQSILSSILSREHLKQELALIEAEIFDKRLQEHPAVSKLVGSGECTEEYQALLHTCLPPSSFEPNLTQYTPVPELKSQMSIPSKLKFNNSMQISKKDDKSLATTGPLVIPTYPSIALLTKPVDQIIASTLELELSDEETEDDRLFYTKLESYIGLSSNSSKKRKLSHTSSILCKGSVSGVVGRGGQLHLKVLLQ